MARQCEEDDFFSIENEVVFVEETEEIGVVSFPSIFCSLKKLKLTKGISSFFLDNSVPSYTDFFLKLSMKVPVINGYNTNL